MYKWTHAVQTHVVQGSTVCACYIIRNRRYFHLGGGCTLIVLYRLYQSIPRLKQLHQREDIKISLPFQFQSRSQLAVTKGSHVKSQSRGAPRGAAEEGGPSPRPLAPSRPRRCCWSSRGCRRSRWRASDDPGGQGRPELGGGHLRAPQHLLRG